uniref:Uncharacterized protein n=1 Tax=Helianthus annuus TaxID=4232 RepID=A0A251TGV2_HELAN
MEFYLIKACKMNRLAFTFRQLRMTEMALKRRWAIEAYQVPRLLLCSTIHPSNFWGFSICLFLRCLLI